MTGEREEPEVDRRQVGGADAPRPGGVSRARAASGRTLASEGPEPEAVADEPGRPAPHGRNGADPSGGAGLVDGGGDDDGYAPFVTFDDYDARNRVRVPRRRRIMRRVALVVGALIVVGLLAAAGTGWWVLRQIDPPGGPGQSLTIVVPDGASAAGIADLLEQSGVIRNSFIFREYIKVKGDGADGHFQPGRYTMSHDSSMSEALAQLKKGPIPPATSQVTFPEGLRLTEIGPRLAAGVPWFTPQGVDAAMASVRSTLQPPDQPSLEGLLFPDTYTFQEGTTEVQAVTQMTQQMEAVGRELGLDAGAAKLGYTPYEVITIASMIEREAAVPEDRGKIARVIYNRLESGMRLDIDATVSYALGGTQRALSASDLEVDSPYNTRLYGGLPPSPIAAPGRASLEAALNPTPGDWLYYVVADKDGSHYFTDSYSDFNDAVAAAEAAGLIP